MPTSDGQQRAGLDCRDNSDQDLGELATHDTLLR